MELEALKYLGAGLTVFGMAGAALGVGNIFAAFLSGVARNPSAEGKLFKYAIIGAGLAEAMGIFALGIGVMLLFVV